MQEKNTKLLLITFIVLSFVVLPAVAFPLLGYIDQVERFSFLLGGYFGISTQIVSLHFKEARIWRVRVFDYDDDKNARKKVGKLINVILLVISTIIFCFGIYYLIIGWQIDKG